MYLIVISEFTDVLHGCIPKAISNIHTNAPNVQIVAETAMSIPSYTTRKHSTLAIFHIPN